MRFFVLGEPKTDTPEALRGSTDAVYEKGLKTGEAIRCPRCNRPLSSLKWLPPYRVELETWGREYGDIIWSGDDLIVSERFVQAYQNSDLRGLGHFEPVEVLKVKHLRGKPNTPMPRYAKATINLSPTAVDPKASGYVWRSESTVCPVCLWDDLMRFSRIVINEDTWNGDDIFYPRGGPRPMVSARFKDVCDEHGLLGAIFTDPDKVSYDYYPWEKGQDQQT